MDKERYELHQEPNGFSEDLIESIEQKQMKTNKINGVVILILDEIERQDAKWGMQSHPFVCQTLTKKGASIERIAEEYEIPTPNRAKQLCEINDKRGTLTWLHILQEEVSEAMESKSVQGKKEELIQVAAVCIRAIMDIDKRASEEMSLEKEIYNRKAL